MAGAEVRGAAALGSGRESHAARRGPGQAPTLDPTGPPPPSPEPLLQQQTGPALPALDAAGRLSSTAVRRPPPCRDWRLAFEAVIPPRKRKAGEGDEEGEEGEEEGQQQPQQKQQKQGGSPELEVQARDDGDAVGEEQLEAAAATEQQQADTQRQQAAGPDAAEEAVAQA